MLRLLLVAVVPLLAGCFDAPNTPNGATTWDANCEEIVTGKIAACYGPMRPSQSSREASSYLTYEIDLERIDSRRVKTVLYQRSFPVSTVDRSLLTWEKRPVVFYNQSNRIVRFDLGKEEHTANVPY